MAAGVSPGVYGVIGVAEAKLSGELVVATSGEAVKGSLSASAAAGGGVSAGDGFEKKEEFGGARLSCGGSVENVLSVATEEASKGAADGSWDRIVGSEESADGSVESGGFVSN